MSVNFESDSDAEEAMDPVLDATITIVPIGPWKQGTPVDELDEERTQELVDATVTLSAPVDLSGHALTILREQLPIPRAFARSGWLRGHHLLELDEQGRAVVEDLSIHHHPTFGLLVDELDGAQEREQASPDRASSRCGARCPSRDG